MFCSWHSRALCCCAVALLAGGLAACSTHPLPQDVAGVSTVDIVKSIRCEARAGIERAVSGLRDDQVAKLVPIIQATVIGYDFIFDMTELNSAGVIDDKTPLLAFTRAAPEAFAGKVNGSATLERNNKRTFTVIEPLANLTKPESVTTCKDRSKGPNWVYPVSGTIGLDEVVRTYLKLELLTELPTQKDNKKSEAQKQFSASHVVFSDELSFTTKFDAGVTGDLSFHAVVGQVRLANASIGTRASRKDEHSVIVALTRAPKPSRSHTSGSGHGSGGGGGGSTAGGGGHPPPTLAFGGGGAGRQDGAALERSRMITDGSVRDPRSQARLIQMNASAEDSVAVELQQRRARKDEDNDGARALGQRFLDLLKEP